MNDQEQLNIRPKKVAWVFLGIFLIIGAILIVNGLHGIGWYDIKDDLYHGPNETLVFGIAIFGLSGWNLISQIRAYRKNNK